MTAKPTPVILVGHTEVVGKAVIAMLEPELEVVHFVMTPEAGARQIPLILAGAKSPPSDSELGSRNYERTPEAVILGGGYDDAQAEQMMTATAAHPDAKPIPWLRQDVNKPAPPVEDKQAHGQALVDRIKELIPRLRREGKHNTAEVQWY